MKRPCAGILGVLLVATGRPARADGDPPGPPALAPTTTTPTTTAPAATAPTTTAPAATATSSVATAAPCGGAGHPGVALRASGLDGALATKITAQLRAALAGRGFELCAADRPEGAVAELDVSNGGAAGVSLSLTVRDQVTDKRVSRELDLRGIPDDGRALVIAEAADELLRASWAELLVADAPKPKRAVPSEVTRTLPALPADREPPSPSDTIAGAPIVEVAVDAAIEHYGSGHTQLGPEIAAGFFPHPRLGLVARLGIRSAASAESVAGSVDPSAVAGGLAVLVAAFPRQGRLGLDGGAELFMVARGWAVVARPLRATVGLSLGAPLHTVRAVADQRTIASVAGVLVGATLGLGGAW
jgi:hypothetical protein